MECYSLKPFISKEQIERRLNELAAEINRDYKDLDLVMVGLLTGAFIFCADLARRSALDPEIDFMRVSSYGSNTCGGETKILMDLKTEIKNRHVLLIEDIIDSGRTISLVVEHLMGREPAGLAVCALIDKTNRRICPVKVDRAAFTFENDYFLVGYGLDFAGKHRNLESIHEVIFNQRKDLDDAARNE